MKPPVIEFVTGPLTSDFDREAAEKGLQRHAAIAQGAPYALDQVEGRWVAAIVHADSPLGGPADQDEEVPGPKSEGPDDTIDLPDEDGPDEGPDEVPDEGPEEDDKHEHDEHKEHGESAVLNVLKQIAEALGISINPAGGEEAPPMDAPLPPPPGPPAPPAPSGKADQHIFHEKALKPGEVPPGATPSGAPAFSHVIRPDHPWAHLAGSVSSFTVQSEIGNRALTEVNNELQALASEIGYNVLSMTPGQTPSGRRTASAVISLHRNR